MISSATPSACKLVLGASLLVGLVVSTACGGAQSKPEAVEGVSSAEGEPQAAETNAAAAASAGANEGEGPGAGEGEGSAQSPHDRPFANSSLEAMRWIDEAIESRRRPIETCVAAARERQKTPHAEIVVELGIDQEGTLLGLKTPKSAPKDPAFLDCVRQALHGAPFPRSKSGVITLKKRFTEQAQRPAP